jgi:hypothetical protein
MLYNILMPGNPVKMINKSRLEQDELQLQSELYALGELPHRRPPKPPQTDTRTARLMNSIYTIFVDNATQLGKPTKLPAEMFDVLKSQYSNTTINKAKKLLLIQSIRRLGRWWWQFPRRAPSEALQTQHARLVKEYNPVAEQLSNLRRPAAIELQEIMKEHHLQITNKLAVELMEVAGYQRPTTLHMKAILGIASMKVNGRWMWLWPNRDVQDWIEEQLKRGPVPREQLRLDAFAQRSWDWDLINLAKKAMPHIHWHIFKGVGYWVDMNHQRAETAENIVELDMSPPDESDRVITVDFEPHEDDIQHDLAPDEPIYEDEEPEVVVNKKIIKLPSGIKLETFE